MPIAIVTIGTFLKLLVLHHSAYEHVHVWAVLHAALTTTLEVAIYLGCLLLWISYLNGFQSIEGQYVRSYRRLCLSLLFPEVFRMLAVVLHVFDSQPDLLVLITLLILSLQCTSYHVVTNLRWESLVPGLALAVCSRLVWMRILYPPSDLWALGGFS